MSETGASPEEDGASDAVSYTHLQIDVIEERTKLHDVTLELNLPYPVKSAVLIPQGIKLPVENGRITLPQIDGYEIVSFELV